MTTRTDFTPEEWTVLLQSLTSVCAYVMTADMTAFGTLKVMRAMGKAVEERPAPAAAQELAQSVVAVLEEKGRNKESVSSPEAQADEDTRTTIRRSIAEAAAVLDAKCDPDEATGFKEWLMDIAQAVAEADKEGSHFGIGGVRVTEKEKAALTEIWDTLGLPAA